MPAASPLPKLDFLRLSATGAEQALPAVPQLHRSEPVQGEAWYRYGQDNLYPQHLLAYRNYSPTHAAILKLKADLLAGEGFLNLPAEAGAFLDEDLLHHLATDMAVFGGMALQVHWARNGTQVATVTALPFAQVRKAVPVQDKAAHYYLSADWAAWMQGRKPWAAPYTLPAYDPSQAKQQPIQVLYWFQYSPDASLYPLAPYHAALPDVLWDYEYSRFKTAHMQNGMFPALHVQVEAEPTEEERQHFQRELKRKFGGSSHAGEVLITYGYDGSGRTTIAPIQVHANADLFEGWAADTVQRIVSAHRLSSPVLAGLPAHGSLGGRSNEIAVAFEHFFNTVIRPQQLSLLRLLQRVLAFTPWATAGLDIANSKPVRLVFSEQLLQQVLTQDELRAELGYAPISTQS